jgi:prenylcysteine oxidase/farnesylcysteine lyase
METETVASRNVVDTLLHDHFGSGVCGPRDAERASAADAGPDFVLGWDC